MAEPENLPRGDNHRGGGVGQRVIGLCGLHSGAAHDESGEPLDRRLAFLAEIDGLAQVAATHGTDDLQALQREHLGHTFTDAACGGFVVALDKTGQLLQPFLASVLNQVRAHGYLAMFGVVEGFILPFVLLSALAGQLADMRDKALIIRWVKLAEIFIMLVGAAGLLMAWQGLLTEAIAIPLMLLALFAMGVHSTFFGPIKYAILPQHLERDEVLGGTGLVEAGTYIAILAGTILAGWIPVQWAAAAVLLTAVVGYLTSRSVPPAPPLVPDQPIDRNRDIDRNQQTDRQKSGAYACDYHPVAR